MTTAAAAARLLAPLDRMALCELAERWAPEIKVHPRELLNAITMAVTEEEFDALPSGHGLLVVDGGRPASTRGRLLVEESNRPGLSIVELMDLFIAGEKRAAAGRNDFPFLALHRDAVLAFAEKRGIKPPSWWKPSRKKPNSRNVSSIALQTFLKEAADGKTTERCLRSNACVKFANKTITDPIWRAAFGSLPANKKMARGRPAKRTAINPVE